MILPTMTPEEKHSQMKIIKEYLLSIPMNKRERIFKKISKTKIFHSYYTEENDIPNMGKWTIVYEAESKKLIKMGMLTLSAYQKYYVSHSKNPTNIGTGIYLCIVNDTGTIECRELPPHYFNRLRERFIEPKGIVQPDFPQLVKTTLTLLGNSMSVEIEGLAITPWPDGTYSIRRDNSVYRKNGYKNFISYHKEGISLGLCTNNKEYVNYTTFIPNSLLRKEQKELQKDEMNRIQQYNYEKRYNPLLYFDEFRFIENNKKTK